MNAQANAVIERIGRMINMGHEKRNACVMRHVTRMMSAPGAGAAQAAGSKQAAWAESKSWYDLVNNPKVPLDKLRELRAGVVLEGIDPSACVAVLHDITELDFSKHASMRGRREIGDCHGLGLEYHPCLALDPVARRFLGVLHDTLISADGPDDAGAVDYDKDPALAVLNEDERRALPFNHRHQLAAHIRYLATLAPELRLTHVADREFDDIPAMMAAHETQSDFVFRVLGNRTVLAGTDGAGAKTSMADLIADLPMRPYKKMGLDARGHAAYGGAKPTRVARLSIGACGVSLYRPYTRGNHKNIKLEAPVPVNLVVIRELDPPPGTDPLCWLLFTSLPVETPEQQAWIGTLYEQRWRIEEYFKLLKSDGFHIEQTHFANPMQVAKILVYYSLAAMALLTMKVELGLPPSGPLDANSYEKVRHAMRQPDDPDLDPLMRLFAMVVRCGGWRGRRTDPIGPRTLMRGMLQLMSTFALVNQFPDLIQALASAHGGGGKNAYTW